MEKLEQNCQSSFSTLRGEMTGDSKPDLACRCTGDCLHHFQYFKIEISLIQMQVSASLSDRDSPDNVGPAILPNNSWNRATDPRKDGAHPVWVLWSVPRGLFMHSQVGSGSQRHLHLRPQMEGKNWRITLKWSVICPSPVSNPPEGRESHIPLYIPGVNLEHSRCLKCIY